MRRRTGLWLCLALLYLVFPLSLLVVRNVWSAVETTLDDYLSEDHVNYDYYEDVPEGLPTVNKRRFSVTLLRHLRDLVHRRREPPGGPGDRKVVLFWTSWFRKAWWTRVRGGVDLEAAHCPETRCVFTHDRAKLPEAAALLFQSEGVSLKDLPEGGRRPGQRWVWVHVEAPPASVRASSMLLRGQNDGSGERRDLSDLFNWTMTYHPSSDVMEPYGALLPLQPRQEEMVVLPETDTADDAPPTTSSLRSALLDEDSSPYRAYVRAWSHGYTINDVGGPSWIPYVDRDPEGVGESWEAFLRRPRLVAWMSSHCHAPSHREQYVMELQQHVTVDVYGKCGTLRCGQRGKHRDDRCWRQVLARKYLFYLAFENAVCDAYVTEKLWKPLVHGLVPVVLGGANYSRYLPPDSYIDALSLTPEQLGYVLQELQESPEKYARYHLWRGFWVATLRPPLCELCFKVHSDTKVATQEDIPGWWRTSGRCRDPLEGNSYLL